MTEDTERQQQQQQQTRALIRVENETFIKINVILCRIHSASNRNIFVRTYGHTHRRLRIEKIYCI